MYFTTLPDHRAPGFDERLHFSRFGKQNMVFRAVSDTAYCDRHVGCLSIKTVLNGAERYRIAGREVTVSPGRFLVLNNDQEYACRTTAATKVTMLSVFFSRTFASSVWRDATCTEESLLDTPEDSAQRLPEFFQTLQDIEPGLAQALSSLALSLDNSGYHADR